MDRGIYSASSGGLYNTRLLQIVGNNLANANTVGFKAQRLVSREQEFADTLIGLTSPNVYRAKEDHNNTPGVVDIKTLTDFTPGPVEMTGNPLNVALRKQNEFFVVSTQNGERLTRAGNFTLDQNGSLVTQDGQQVIGEGGPITLTPGKTQITSSGAVMVNGEQVGKLRIASVEDFSTLEREEGTRFLIKGGGQSTSVTDPDLVPEAVEMPNLNIVDSMVAMISAHKSFEAYTKSVQTINDLNDRAIRGARSTG